MSNAPRRTLLKIALGLALMGQGLSAAWATPDLPPSLLVPDEPLTRGPPGLRNFGPDGPIVTPGAPGVRPGATLRAEEQPGSAGKPDDAKPAEPKAQPSRAEMLDRLFDRLAKATDADEATGIAGLIQHVWMHSGSDTADLLMARALEAMGGDHKDVARTLLDKIILIDPDWAEAWNKRATLRFLDNDDAGSMEDISHTLAIEPRHFGALSGLGFILKRNGLEKGALSALRKAQQIYPENSDINKAVDELVPEVEGRSL